MLLTASDVGRQLGISRRAVYDLAYSGRLICYRVGANDGAMRFAPADVETYLASCRSTGQRVTSAGALSSTAMLRAADTDLHDCFRKAGVKLKLTRSTARKPRASMALHLASPATSP